MTAHSVHLKHINEEPLQAYSNEEIAAALMVFGQVKEVLRPDSRPTHNYCFVQFETVEGMIAALKSGSVRINGQLFLIAPSFKSFQKWIPRSQSQPTPSPALPFYPQSQPFFPFPQYYGAFASGVSVPGTAESVEKWTGYEAQTERAPLPSAREEQGPGARQAPSMPKAMREQREKSGEVRKVGSSLLGSAAGDGRKQDAHPAKGRPRSAGDLSPLVLSSSNSSPRRRSLSPIPRRSLATSSTGDSLAPPNGTPRDRTLSSHLGDDSAFQQPAVSAQELELSGGVEQSRRVAMDEEAVGAVEQKEPEEEPEMCFDSAAELKARTFAESCSLVVRNLAESCTSSLLQEFASQDSLAAVRVEAHGYYVGEGFLQYSRPSEADDALAILNGRMLLGRRVRLQRI